MEGGGEGEGLIDRGLINFPPLKRGTLLERGAYLRIYGVIKTFFTMFAKPDLKLSRLAQLSRILPSHSRDYIRLWKQGKCFLLLNCRAFSIRLELDTTPNWVSCKDILS